MNYERAIARTYDDVYARVRDPSGDREFYRRLAIESGGPALELGCGTGRVLLPIAAAGVAVTGVDPSEAMLDVLRSKGPPPNVTLAQSTMQELDLPGQLFAFAYCPFRAFQHLMTVGDQLAALARIRAHLRPGGRLALDVFDPNPARMALSEEPEAKDLDFELDGKPATRWFSVVRDRATQSMTIAFRFTDASGATIGIESIAMRWIWRFELEHLLARAGFEPEGWWSDYRGRPYDAGGDIVVVARRA